MKLAIISHTVHYITSNGAIIGWGPTVREINHLSKRFDKIIHIAPLLQGEVLPGCMPYESDNIEFVPLKPSGGDSLMAKFSVLKVALYNTRIVNDVLKQVDLFQFRAPTGMGVYLLPWLYCFSGKKGWVKYAGNWEQKNPPCSYAFQKWWVTRMKNRKVTINGFWEGQPSHCLSFENPCLTNQEREDGRKMMTGKEYSTVLNIAFIGRLEKAKGADIIIEALRLLNQENRIGKVHFIGDSQERDFFYNLARPVEDQCVFHGFVPRNGIPDILSHCHLFVLPSASEGFPKSIAEAANYGCIPVVSDVSCIGQYVINGINGYLIPENNRTGEQLAIILKQLLANEHLDQMAREAWKLSEQFTFEHYTHRILNEVIV